MGRIACGCLFLVALAADATAQTHSRLSERLTRDVQMANPRSLDVCDFGMAMNQLAQEANLLLGFEQPRTCWLGRRGPHGIGDPQNLTGMTIRQALNHIVGMMPGYRWREVDGVIVVRPQDAWNDPHNPLNFPTAPFEAADGDSHGLLEAMLSATTPPVLTPHTDVASQSMNRPVSVSFPGGTLLDALNALVRAHGDSEWQLGYEGGRATVVVGTVNVSEASVMAPLSLPLPRLSEHRR